ncbi:hypothetical protein NDI76_19965 [Halogeometricum sp. S1BR25-6]|uniref:Uncharacterized protein n=1 Tax=Halogeometricum salsisoli TaxID=2950536 RepID=A0ABU2GJM6_9EURY|nr:hypothetical protein [Halogeometricum sp. S1BR25-6]MDS0301022.1 hypothetical protein [Halogeometricum sp. S1BR25-6]
MGDDLNLSRAFGKCIVYLFTSLLVAIVIVFFLGDFSKTILSSGACTGVLSGYLLL